MTNEISIQDSEVQTCVLENDAISVSLNEQDWVYVWRSKENSQIDRVGATWLHPAVRAEKHMASGISHSGDAVAFRIRKGFERGRVRDLLALHLVANGKADQNTPLGTGRIQFLEPIEANAKEAAYVEAMYAYLYPVDWAPPTIETDRLRLRAVVEDDAAAIFKYASNPEVTKYCFFDTHKTIDDARFFIHKMAFPSYAKKTPEPFAITLKTTGELVGCCGSFWVSRNHRTMELGYIIDEPYWGQGMVVEASRAVVDFVFANYPIERLQCRCKMENLASQRVMAKLGFKQEGVLRSALWHRNRSWDMYMTSLLKGEWEAERRIG